VKPQKADSGGFRRRSIVAGANICIGTIVRPVGIQGNVRIVPHCLPPGTFMKFDVLYLDDGHSVKLKNQRLSRGNTVTAKIVGCDDRNAAEALRSKELFAGPDTTFPSDVEVGEENGLFLRMLSMRVFNDGGEEIGSIESVNNFGAGDILGIKLRQHGKSAFIPYNKGAVLAVNREEGTITVNTSFFT
jgi:16S rRNA processing protein RimM